MSADLMKRLAAGPLLGLLTADTYRAALSVLGGTQSDGYVRWGLGLSMFSTLGAWAHAFNRSGGVR